jgi:hypothetical protein
MTFLASNRCILGCPIQDPATPTSKAPSLFTPYASALLVATASTSTISTASATSTVNPATKTGCPVVVGDNPFVAPSIIIDESQHRFAPFNKDVHISFENSTSLYYNIPELAPFSWSSTCTLLYVQDPTAPHTGAPNSSITIASLSINGTNQGDVAAALIQPGSQGILNFPCKPGQGFGFEISGADDGQVFGFKNSYMAPAVGFFISVCV